MSAERLPNPWDRAGPARWSSRPSLFTTATACNETIGSAGKFHRRGVRTGIGIAAAGIESRPCLNVPGPVTDAGNECRRTVRDASMKMLFMRVPLMAMPSLFVLNLFLC